MTPLEALAIVRAALEGALTRTDVLVGRVPTTPTQPYVVLTMLAPIPRASLGGHSHKDRVTVMVMAVNNSHEGCLLLAQRCRDAVDGLIIDGGPLRYSFGSAAIEDDEPGDYRWSQTLDFVAHLSRNHPEVTP